MDENGFSRMKNLGFVLQKKLETAGISSPAMLKELGSWRAFLLVRANDSAACINTLYAIEGAIRGIRWHDLDPSAKLELLELFRLLEKADHYE
ncbi:MAG: TfoX/Sxy family DNA transformation protein [Bacteroidales bacterium]|nr:TfoX/Sxy family DNA transformation protein [Bacteroidales bacterium]